MGKMIVKYIFFGWMLLIGWFAGSIGIGILLFTLLGDSSSGFVGIFWFVMVSGFMAGFAILNYMPAKSESRADIGDE